MRRVPSLPISKIAIIGSDISALGIGYCLDEQHQVTFLAHSPYISGHNRTRTTQEGEANVSCRHSDQVKLLAWALRLQYRLDYIAAESKEQWPCRLLNMNRRL